MKTSVVFEFYIKSTRKRSTESVKSIYDNKVEDYVVGISLTYYKQRVFIVGLDICFGLY